MRLERGAKNAHIRNSDVRLRPLEQNLLELGAPTDGMITLKVTRVGGFAKTVNLVYQMLQVPSERFRASSNRVLDLLSIPKFGYSNIRFTLRQGKIIGIKVLEEARSIDIQDISISYRDAPGSVEIE